MIQIARIKNLARSIGITKIAQKQQSIVFNFSPETFQIEWVDMLLKKFRNQIKFSPAKDPYITYKVKEDVLKEVQEFLETLK